MTQVTESLPDPEDYQRIDDQVETQSMPPSRPSSPPPPPPLALAHPRLFASPQLLGQDVGHLVREHNEVRGKINDLSRMLRERSSAARQKLEQATQEWWVRHIEQTVVETYFATGKLDARTRFSLMCYPSGGLIPKNKIFDMLRESQVCHVVHASDGAAVVSMTVAGLELD